MYSGHTATYQDMQQQKACQRSRTEKIVVLEDSAILARSGYPSTQEEFRISDFGFFTHPLKEAHR